MHANSLHYMYYNLGRIHKSLGVTPAMAAGVADHVWTLEEIAGLVKVEVQKKKRALQEKKFKLSNYPTSIERNL